MSHGLDFLVPAKIDRNCMTKRGQQRCQVRIPVEPSLQRSLSLGYHARLTPSHVVVMGRHDRQRMCRAIETVFSAFKSQLGVLQESAAVDRSRREARGKLP